MASSWNFHRLYPTASASSLLCSLCTPFPIKPDSDFWITQRKSHVENLCFASLLTHSSLIVSPTRFLPVMSPIWQIRLSLNKHTSEERGNADLTTRENKERQYYNSREVSDSAKAKALKTHIDTYRPALSSLTFNL